jgi:hypothetical protein
MNNHILNLGISNEATNTHDTTEICLTEIKNVNNLLLKNYYLMQSLNKINIFLVPKIFIWT